MHASQFSKHLPKHVLGIDVIVSVKCPAMSVKMLLNYKIHIIGIVNVLKICELLTYLNFVNND